MQCIVFSYYITDIILNAVVLNVIMLYVVILSIVAPVKRRYDTQHNDIQHNGK